MAVTLVIGRAGAGRTTRCFTRIVDAMRADPLGPPIFWIVPKQATFMAERQLTCESDLWAFCRTQVMSFEQLANEAFLEVGRSATAQVTPLGRHMILGHLLRRLQPRLGYYRSSARQAGLAAELDATFGDLERAGKGAADLAQLVADLEITDPVDADGDALLSKLRDLRLVYDAYHAFLGQDRLDPHRRQTEVHSLLQHWPLLRGATVYVDGFLEFSEDERRTLAILGRVCREVEITLAIDPASPTVQNPHHLPEDGSLFRRTEQSYRRLWFMLGEEGVSVNAPVVLRETARFRESPGLGAVERWVFDAGERPANPQAAAGLEMTVAPNRGTEVEGVARRIRGLLSEGYRLRDIAVLARSLDDYAPLIDTVFREHGLPCFVDRRRTAAHHPLLQFVRSSLQVARLDWPHEAIMGLLKSGLACLGADEADELEEYVLLHRIRGGTAWESPEPWSYRRDLTRPRGDEEADDVSPARSAAERADAFRRALHDRMRPLIGLAQAKEPPLLRTFATTLLEQLEACSARQTLSAWMQAAAQEGDFEQHDEHAQVWTELNALLDQMVDLLGDEPVTAGEFVEILESGLERFDLGITPPTLDQVLVGQVDRTRTPSGLRACFVLGLNAGEFPRAARDHTVLTDSERRELARRKVEVDGDTRQKLLDERLLGYFAFTRASDLLFVSRSAAGESGRPTEPSAFWLRLRALFPTLDIVQDPPQRAGTLEQIWTPRELVVSLMEWARGDDRDAEGKEAAYQWLATIPQGADAGIDAVRNLAWRALAYRNDARLSREVSSRLFAPPLRGSAARLEVFASCAFRHFVKYGLALTEREPPGVTGLDLSRVYHHVLQALVSAAVDDDIDLADPSAPISDQTIHALVDDIGHSLRGELMMSSARNEYLLSRVERTLREVVAAQREMLRRGTMRPTRAGVSFGEGTPRPPVRVKTKSGADVAIGGTIDRLDTLPDGAGLAVYDYRLGGQSLSLQKVYYGLSLQLLTGLLALADAGQPAAAFYLQTTRGIGSVKHPSDALDPSDPKHLLRVKPRGVVEGGFVPAFDSALADGISDVLQVSVRKTDKAFGNRRASDVATREEFDALLAHVRKKLAELADGVLSGEVGVHPYRIGTETPCPHCGYQSVCRIDPAVGHYRNLAPLGKEQVFIRLTRGGENEG